MFKGLDDLKKKTLETAQETTDELGDRSDALQDDIASAGDRATTQAAELTRETTDRARRTAGKLSSRWSEPETRVEKKLMKELIWFICNDCHSELGPLELGKWKRFIKDAIVGGAGVLTGNPILMVKGVAGAAGTAAKGDQEPGMLEKLKGDSKRQSQAREYLVQCEHCSDWYCSACWVSEKRICKECSAKVEKGIELPKLASFSNED